MQKEASIGLRQRYQRRPLAVDAAPVIEGGIVQTSRGPVAVTTGDHKVWLDDGTTTVVRAAVFQGNYDLEALQGPADEDILPTRADALRIDAERIDARRDMDAWDDWGQDIGVSYG